MLSSIFRAHRLGVWMLVLGVALWMSLLQAPAAHAYTNDPSGAYQWGADFCASHDPHGLGDYVWVTAPDGSTTVTITAGDSFAPLNAYVGGQYCDQWPSGGKAWNTFSDLTGRISGSFDVYPRTGAGNQFLAGPQQAWLDVRGLAPGTYMFQITLRTQSNQGYKVYDSPSARVYLTLVVKSPWDTSGESRVGVDHTPNVQQWDAQPGQTVTWNHGIWNTTGYGTDEITAAVARGGFRPSSGLNGNQYPWWPGAKFTLDKWGSYWFGKDTGNYDDDTYFKYVINQEDVGAGVTKDAICQFASWGPSWYGYKGGEPWRSTSPACVRVPYKFNLTTHIDMNTAAVEPGTAIAPINPYIDNAGPTRGYNDTAWQVSKFILAPGKAIPGEARNANNPCAYYANGCVPQGTGSGTYDPGSWLVGQIGSYTVEDLPIGSRVCFALSVNKYDPNQIDGKRWYHGPPECVMIGKKPKVQVLGGDVATRAGISTSLTQKSTGVYGSWVEYGAFSVGPNINFATGAGLSANPTAQSSSAQVSWSKLTFANVDAAKNQKFGQYYSSTSGFRQLPNITQYFSAFSNKQPFIGDKPSDNAFPTGGAVVVRSATGKLTLHSDQLGMIKTGGAVGQSTVIVSDDDVTIDGDLTYINGELLAANQIPQLVIIAKNINITAKVQQVDAWLIATDPTGGVINTCSDGPVSLTGNDCNNPLTIHGPVEARQLLLRRTAGSGVGQPGSGDPAEVIDMRADTYLWAQQIAAGAGKAQTVYMTELPPRF